MGLLIRAMERREHPSNPAATIKWSNWIDPTSSGVSVTEESSLRYSAVFACVRVLAESVASLPLILYRREDNGVKARAEDHPLYKILHDSPNPEMTSLELRELMMTHLCLWGNAYGEIEYNRRTGAVVGIWPLRPDRMEVKRENGDLRYEYRLTEGGRKVILRPDQVLHVPGLGVDGVMGLSPISLVRQGIGLGLATEEFGSRFFGNGARPGVVFEHPGMLSDDAYDRLKRSVEERHQGLENAHRLMILEEGMGIKEVGIPPEDAQFLETRKFQTNEIARIYRVPPHMIGDLERATFSNVEQQSLDFVVHSLRPWLVRLEQRIGLALLLERERPDLFAEHLVDGLLRGDIQSRYQAYSVGRQNGWLSANDVRAFENMNPIEGGDEYLVPLNMIPAGQLSQANQPDPGPEPEQSEQPDQPEPGGERQARAVPVEVRQGRAIRDRRALANSFLVMMDDVAGRVFRREINDLRRAIKKFLGRRDVTDFNLWLTEFYTEHKEFIIRNFLPVLRAYAEQIGLTVGDELEADPDQVDIEAWLDQYLLALAARTAGSSQLQLQALIDEALLAGDDPSEALVERLDAWEETRAEKFALEETWNANNALAKTFYIGLGVQLLRWVASGENCPYCRDMDGKVVGVNEWFLEKDTEFEPDGAERPLSRRVNVGHHPLHRGCDCVILAEKLV